MPKRRFISYPARMAGLALLAILVTLTSLAGCGAQAFPAAMPLAAADLTAIELAPFAGTESGIQGLAPEGWIEAMPLEIDHFFLSGPPLTRPGTALIQRFEANASRQGALDIWLPLLGLEDLPERSGERQTEGLAWDTYTYETEDPSLGPRRGALAVAKSADGVYLVILVTQPHEYEALYEAVFLPAIDALGPDPDPASRYDEYAAWPVVAELSGVGNNAHESVDFRLDACSRLRLYAIGQRDGAGMVDYGYVENAASGQIVWQMHAFETESAGYWQNRRADRPLTLPPGDYRLHFQTDGSHAFDDWGDGADGAGAQPPGHRFWGIRLFADQDPDLPPAQCLPRADRPEDLGWSATELAALGPELEDRGLAAVMVLTDGQVVYDWGNTANNLKAHSMRKSLMSALYGIAIEQGTVDPGQSLGALGIDDIQPLTETEKGATVADLLQARSGVYLPASGEAASMKASRPERGSHEPGSQWYYNNWDFNTLGSIFEQETGRNIYAAFADWIATPTGMQDFQPERLRYTYEYWLSGHPYYGFRISARDLARFGQLYLDGGAWQGGTVVPAAWVKESTRAHSKTGKKGTYSGYGYMWWIAARDDGAIAEGSYAASGYGGHTVEVLPELDTVIVLRVNTDGPGPYILDGDEVDGVIATILSARSSD